MILDKDTKEIQWKKNSLSNKWSWNNWTSVHKPRPQNKQTNKNINLIR